MPQRYYAFMKLALIAALSPAERPVPFTTITLPRQPRVAVFAPHPDDFDAIAVTLWYLREHGADIRLAVLTTGASGVENGYAGTTTDMARSELREREQRASGKLFGLLPEHIEFLRLPEDDAGLIVDKAAIAAASAWLAPQAPDLVFMPHGNDSNITHQRTYALFRMVAEREALSTCALLNRDAKTLDMRNDVVMAFDEEAANWKARLLRLHASQHQRNLNTRGHGFDERVLAVNRATAQSLGCIEKYAEAFEIQMVRDGRAD
jgi:LmbE family N-acetylglucosaminyl deacetylase